MYVFLVYILIIEKYTGQILQMNVCLQWVSELALQGALSIYVFVVYVLFIKKYTQHILQTNVCYSECKN